MVVFPDLCYNLIMLKMDLETKKSIRGAFGEELAELGKVNKDIVALDADLSGSTQTCIFAKTFPERFFDVGIAEQNLMTTALGLSLEGKIPFAATFAVFATGRAYDQIRNSICYQKGNVKIIGAHGGITVGEDGATHQSLEDVSLMRGLPNMTVICPGDYEECRQAVRLAAKIDGPVYIRLSRANVPVIFSEKYNMDLNKAVIIKEGSDVSLITSGDILSEVVKAAKELENHNINAEIIHVPVIKPFDAKTIIKSVEKTKLAVTIENHSVIGGLGSAVCECLSELSPQRVFRIGINDTFTQSGTPNELLKHYKLDAASISEKVIELKNDTTKICNKEV